MKGRASVSTWDCAIQSSEDTGFFVPFFILDLENIDFIIELLDDIIRDLNNYDLEFRIQELESRFSQDLSEATFNELKELKKKQNIN